MAAKKTTPKTDERVTITLINGREQSVQKKYGSHVCLANVIRAMKADGLSAGQISKDLGIRYQHVRNTLADTKVAG